MWYIDGHKWDSDTYNEAVDGMLNNPAMAEAVMGLVESDSRAILMEGRCTATPSSTPTPSAGKTTPTTNGPKTTRTAPTRHPKRSA